MYPPPPRRKSWCAALLSAPRVSPAASPPTRCPPLHLHARARRPYTHQVSAAVAKGINFFDNAEVYADGKAELMMGRVVKRAAWDRRQLVISTKIFQTTKSRGALGPGPNDYGLSRKHVVEGLRASLQRLQMDYVDIVFAHRYDRHTPMEEVVRAFNHVIDKGWALYWGTSEWSADQIWEAHHVADRLHLVGPTAEQPQYNMLWRQRFEVEYASLFEQKGMGSTIWSPLASGLLTGKYAVGQAAPQGSRLADARFKRLENRTGPVDRQLVKVRALEGVAKELGCSMPQLAIAWTLSNAHVSTVLLGGTKVRHIEENIASLKVVSKLTGEVLARIDQAMGGAEDDQAALRVAVGTDWTGRDGMSNMQTRT